MVRLNHAVRQAVVSFRITEEIRALVEQLSARLTIKQRRRFTLTDVLEEAIRRLAEQEGVK